MKTKFFLLLVVNFIFIGCNRWSDKSIKATEACGTKIVKAINQYYKDNGVLPNSLDNLKPAYLLSVPSPIVGSKRWEYDVVGTNNFHIRVTDLEGYTHSQAVLFFDNSQGKWILVMD